MNNCFCFSLSLSLSLSLSPPKIPEVEDIDEDEAAALEEAFDRDYDVAQSLRSHVIPQAVLWFTGEVRHLV